MPDLTDGSWHDLAAADDVPDGDVVGRVADGTEVALYRIGDEVFATDALCTHGNANLCGGFVEPDGSIECPLHQGRFDIRSGKALCEPLEHDLRVHAVRLEGGRVLVRLHPG
ncbi:MAG: non-heme iron oxygenase ferredoxin subunit [Chitinophagaceae bacterium]|nr:non-heme iron oxygenase ferredoxin subunit [Rubrivivax sp.]